MQTKGVFQFKIIITAIINILIINILILSVWGSSLDVRTGPIKGVMAERVINQSSIPGTKISQSKFDSSSSALSRFYFFKNHVFAHLTLQLTKHKKWILCSKIGITLAQFMFIS